MISRFHPYKDSEHCAVTKLNHNQNIVTFINKYLRGKINILSLDGETRLSTKTFQEFVRNLGSIYTPEWDYQIYQNHLEAGETIPFHMSMGQFIIQHKELLNKINVGYFDYCGNIDGNRQMGTFPLYDIDKYLFSCPDAVVVGITYSLRGIPPPHYNRGVDKIKDIIKSNNFDIRDHQIKFYKSNKVPMKFLLFYLEKSK